MSKLRRGKEQRKADREQKKQTPKVKMRSYGGGEKLPIVKTGKDFYLADQKYDNLGVGEFSGQKTGKLEGPSKRAIKGKGKKSGNVRVADKQDEVGNEIFLKDTSPMKMENDYSSMKSMGQAVARWTSPLSAKGESFGVLKSDKREEGKGRVDAQGNYEFSPEKWMQNGYTYNTGKFAKNPKYLSKPQPGSNPQAAANTKLGIEKPIPKYIKRPEEEPKKKTKTSGKEKFKPLEKVEKRGEGINSMGEATYKTDVNLPQFSDSVTLSTSKITTKEEADKSRERRDNERMQKAVELANASETLLKGKEKRKLAQYDRQAKRGSEESKLKRRTAATKGVQALGSLLADIGKENSEIKPVGVAAEKASTDKPEDDKKTTTGQRKFDITNLSF